jgi:phosphoribosylpyrophosphate synthetase
MINAELHTAMGLIKNIIPRDTVIVFPDEWAQKRFSLEFEWYETIVCSKVRDGDKRKVTIKEGNPNGKKLLIVDDLIQSGGTIRETAELLRSLWGIKVDAFATHGVFPNASFVGLASCLDTLYTTDSLPKNKDYAWQVSNMNILSITPLVEKILFRS